jgi:ABC-2 type transport system permease protein
MISLVQNEVMKLLLKKKMVLIILLVLVFTSLFAYGEKYTYDKNIERFENASDATTTDSATFDWKSLSTQRLEDMKERLDSPYIPESGIQSIVIEIEQLTYFIENDINPITPSAAKFSVEFIEQGIVMLIPLLVIILAADLVSGEFTAGTIKLLLTRAIPRWKILLSKYFSLIMMTTLVMFLIGIIATGVSFAFFGRWGFDQPVATGFNSVGGVLNSDAVILVTSFEYMMLVYALAWFVSIVIATITFMVSVIVKSTSTAIGILMATLIGGQFLQFFLSDWEIVKYFYVTNLNLTRYLTGSYQPIEGMNLVFSIIVLGIWAIISLVISFQVFDRKDVLV